jgi:lysine decarboxylase
MVTNGTSTSNKIVGMYSAPAGSTLLIDRNCHKSLAHLLMMSDVVPLWLKPTRNALGILGGIPRREPATHSAESARHGRGAVAVHAVITNSTYDGLLYNTTWLKRRSMSRRSISIPPGCPIPISIRYIREKRHER